MSTASHPAAEWRLFTKARDAAPLTGADRRVATIGAQAAVAPAQPLVDERFA